jgi:hypothetical protein
MSPSDFHILGALNLHPDQAEVLEELRKKLARVMGVTLQGNRLTVRWGAGNTLHQVTLIVDEIWPTTWDTCYQKDAREDKDDR